MSVAAITVVGDASMMRSANCASCSRFKSPADGVSTIRTLDGKHCKNSSRIKVASIVSAMSPKSCCMRCKT